MDTVLITGTTSGIGAAFAEKFARERNNLVLVSRNKAKLQRQQTELQTRYQVSVECISCDLAENGATELIADKARELEMIQVHIKVLTALTKLFLPEMIELNAYDYDEAFGTYHTSRQMAEFLLKLYDSDSTLGIVDRETFQFKLQPPVFPYANSSTHNQNPN